MHNFLTKVASLTPGKPETVSELKQRLIAEIQEQVGDKQVLLLVSGGVDSNVCLALFKEALKPEQIFAVFVDNGFMRTGETEKVEKDIFDATGVKIRVVRGGDDFLNAKMMYEGSETPPLRKVTDPEMKRNII